MSEKKYIRVDELIEMLKQLPPDLPVYDWNYEPVEGIREKEICINERKQEYLNVAFID